MNFESRIRLSERGDATASFHLVGSPEAISAAHNRIMEILDELKREFAARAQMERAHGCSGCGEGFSNGGA